MNAGRENDSSATRSETDRMRTLRDGRNMAFVELGDPAGMPCFFFHGTPGSRRCLGDDPLLREYGIRVIAPDRPGMGLSDPHPARSLATWADDVAQLADGLGIEAFHVAGASGGGPHALACGVHLADRVRSVTLVSTAVPPDLLGRGSNMSRANRITFLLARYAPWLCAWSFRSYAKAVEGMDRAYVEGMKKQLCAWDRKVLEEAAGSQDLSDLFLRDLREAFRQGHRGVLADFLLVARPWSLDLSALRAPVHLWHGEADTLVPVDPVRSLVPHLPGCTAHLLPEAGHMLLESDLVGRDILQAIRDAGSRDHTLPLCSDSSPTPSPGISNHLQANTSPGPKPRDLRLGVHPKSKDTPMSSTPSCPKCQYEYTYEEGTEFVCSDCGHRWSAIAEAAPDEEGFVVRDANGNVLADGDSVVMIKELKVKGAPTPLKAGTKVRNIRLVDGDHNIDCRIDGFGAMALKSEFVRKA